VLDVVDRNGEPDPGMAHSLREIVKGDGMLARVPTPEEYDFLKAQRKERGYGKGSPSAEATEANACRVTQPLSGRSCPTCGGS
jgi:hypothetical protein